MFAHSMSASRPKYNLTAKQSPKTGAIPIPDDAKTVNCITLVGSSEKLSEMTPVITTLHMGIMDPERFKEVYGLEPCTPGGGDDPVEYYFVNHEGFVNKNEMMREFNNIWTNKRVANDQFLVIVATGQMGIGKYNGPLVTDFSWHAAASCVALAHTSFPEDLAIIGDV